MPFLFPLAMLLRVRILTEEREEQALRQVLQDIARTEQSIKTADSDILQGQVGLSARISKTLEGRDLQLSHDAIKAIQNHREDLRGQLEKLEQLKEAQLTRYQSARQNREMLNDLQHKHRVSYEARLGLQEQKMLDGIFANRQSRNRKLGGE